MPHATREPAGDKGTADRIPADDGHAWVRLTTWQALDREGACMGHCVGDGDYDTVVGSEELHDDAIWSLRRPDGVSVLTAQVEELWVQDAYGPRNSKVGRFEAMQVAHLVAAFKEAGHALRVSEDTEIVLLEDGRTCRVDRLPRDVVAARAEAARRLEEERGLARAAVRDLSDIRRDALGRTWFTPFAQVVFRPSGRPAFSPLGDVASVEFLGGGASGYGPAGGSGGRPGGGGGGGVAVGIEARTPAFHGRDTFQTAVRLTRDGPDPVVREVCTPNWETCGSDLEYTLRSGRQVRLRSREIMQLVAAGNSKDLAFSQAFVRAYRAVVEGQAPVPEIPTSPSGFEQLWGRGGRTVEQAPSTGPGQPATAAPPAESYGRDLSRMRPSTLARVLRFPVGLSLFGHEATYTGPWQRFQAYEPGAIVAHAGLPYIAMVSVPPAELPPQDENAALWRLIDATFIEGCERVFAGGSGGTFETLGDEHNKLRVDGWDQVLSGIVPIAEPPS